MRLAMTVIDGIKEIGNLEYSDLCLHSERINKFGSKTTEGPVLLGDSRPFSRFLHTPSLKAVTSFMSSSHTDLETPQVNTIYCCG